MTATCSYATKVTNYNCRIRDRPNSQLRLRMSLHGKLYRADQRCLVGSANLTGAALGWGFRANLELLAPMPAATEEIRDFERQLLLGSVIVDQPIYSTTLEAVDALRKSGITYPMQAAQDEAAQMCSAFETWLPTCHAPDRLYDAYRGRNDRMLTSAYQDALDDLRAINPPVGLDRDGFTAYVISKLEQHPVIRQLDDYVAIPRSSEEVSRYLSAQTALPPDISSTEAAEILKLWLLNFFPNRYRARPPEGVDVFVRGARIG
jgi:hypothetical protein